MNRNGTGVRRRVLSDALEYFFKNLYVVCCNGEKVYDLLVYIIEIGFHLGVAGEG